VPGRQTERFLTTVLFTDIVGSTEVAAELGDRAWRELVEEHHRLVREALKRHGGREVDTAGDGFFAIFDAPAAAADCALDAIEAVQALGIQIRAGLHVGEVEKSGPKVTGISVPTAARIMAAAGGGELLVSSTVRDLAAGSGLHFEDRGERQLKGVPGTWHLYAVTRGGQAAAAAGRMSSADRAARRAAAVRRAEARPVWQRHPGLSAGVAIGLAGVIVGSAALAWSPWRPRALAGVEENSIGIIDPSRNEIVAATKVDEQPADIAFGEGAVWVTNAESNTVSRINPLTRAVLQTIDVGKTPAGITTGHGSVWVANSGGRSVSRINAQTNRVVDEIEVGNGPTAIAFGADTVWVTNAGDGTLSRIDAATGKASTPISVTSLPVAMAVAADGLWVASQDGASVSHLDPASGAALSAPIPVGWRPSSVALGAEAAWVANTGSGGVSRIDTATGSVVGVVDVGGSPTSVAVDGSTLWVADADGAVLRVDTANLGAPPVRIATSSSPQAIAVVNHEVWFASRASEATHRGGVLRVVSDTFDVDPAAFSSPEFQSLIGDTLVGYPRVGGIIGSQLIPALATAVPKPTDGGLTYAFRLRSGIRYSDGSPLHASDFVLGIEHDFQVYDPRVEGSVGGGFYSAIVGADACEAAVGKKCDLSMGMVADDAANTLVIHLKEPDPDLLYKLTLSFARPFKPGSMPEFAYASHPFPGTGPYQIASITPEEVRLIRNPYFHSWDAHVRPKGFADEVIWTLGVSPADQVRLVEAGKADYMVEQIPADAFHILETEYTPQLHLAAQSTMFVFMNTKLAPFDRLDVRRAVNFAMDRKAVAALRGGGEVTSVTCQLLPPNFPGYQPYCPYTEDPAPNGRGRWTAPDLETAKKLVAESGQAGTNIVVGPFAPRLTPLAKYVVGVLKQIGFRNVTERDAKEGEEVFNAIYKDKNVQMGAFEFIQDYPGPDTFLSGFTCAENDGFTNNCDPKLDALVQQARDLQATDPSAAADKWAEADRMVVDLALWAPLLNEGSDFVSARVRNYQYNLSYGVLLDQMWVQ
jgi:peptide/nickel transport system substrate-binding protein